MSWFPFHSEGCFCCIEFRINSSFLFFPALEKIFVIYFWTSWFLKRNLLLFELFSHIDKVFICFIFSFQNFGYNTQIYLGFSCLSAHLLAFAIFSSKSGTFSAVISSSTALLPFSFWVSQWRSMLDLRGTAHFFSVCFLSLVQIRSFLLSCPQAYSVFLHFILFCCEPTHWVFLFWLLYFPVVKLPFNSSFIFSLCTETF